MIRRLSELWAEMDESERRGYGNKWEVPKDVSLVTRLEGQPAMEGSGQGIIEAQGLARSYYPMAFPSLRFELAKVDFGSVVQAQAFVRQWGLLGYDYVNRPRMIRGGGEDLGTVGGDPLWFIWWHARTVRDTLELLHGLQVGDEDALYLSLDRILQPDWYTNTDSGDSLFAPGTIVADTASGQYMSRRHVTPFSSPIDAGDAIARMINGNVRGVHPTIFSRRSKLSRGFTFNTLIEAIWVHVMDMVTGGQEMAICKECNSYFQRTDKRQKFCPSREFHAGRAQSLCGLRYHTRESRKRSPKRKGDKTA